MIETNFTREQMRAARRAWQANGFRVVGLAEEHLLPFRAYRNGIKRRRRAMPGAKEHENALVRARRAAKPRPPRPPRLTRTERKWRAIHAWHRDPNEQS